MQAINVSPIPVANAPIDENILSSKAGDDTEFAPLLAKTIKNQKHEDQQQEPENPDSMAPTPSSQTPLQETETVNQAHQEVAENTITQFTQNGSSSPFAANESASSLPISSLTGETAEVQISFKSIVEIAGTPAPTNQSGQKPDQSGLKPEQFELKPEQSGLKPEQFGLKPEQSGLKPEQYGLEPVKSGLKPQFSSDTPAPSSISGNEKFMTHILGQQTSQVSKISSLPVSVDAKLASQNLAPEISSSNAGEKSPFSQSQVHQPDIAVNVTSVQTNIANTASETDSLAKQHMQNILSSDERNSITLTRQPIISSKESILPGRLPIQAETNQISTPQQQTVSLPESLLATTFSEKNSATPNTAIKQENTLSLRQNLHEATFRPTSIAGKQNTQNEGQQQNFMSNGDSLQQEAVISSATKSVTPFASDSNTPFSIPSVSPDISAALTGTETVKATPFTPTANLHEHSILNQVIQRFQIQSQLRTSKMVLKLHPAELGELRVDIAVKEGSLKANFMAQSQQVQEVLEKQIPKLREAMAQHGLNVEDILVTLDPESVEKHEFSQGNFNNDSFTASKKQSDPKQSFDQSLEQLLTVDESVVDSGINVKA